MNSKNKQFKDGFELENSGEFAKAIDLYQEIIKDDPDNFIAHYNIANCYAKLNDYEQAIIHYDLATRLNPTFAEAWYNKAVTYHKVKDDKMALLSFDKALEIAPDDYKTWFEKGNTLCDLKEHNEAILCYKKVIALNRDYKPVWNNLAVVYAELEQFDEALNYYNKAIELAPRNYFAWYNKGSLLLKNKKNKDAIDCFALVVNYKPDYEMGWNKKGDAHIELNEYEKALFCYNKCIEINPDNYQNWMDKGTALFDSKKMDDALEAFQKALEINPLVDYVWYCNARTLSFLDKNEEALKAINQAINLAPDNDNYLYEKGLILRYLENTQLALEALSSVVEINKDHYSAWIAKGQLEFVKNEYEKTIESLMHIDSSKSQNIVEVYELIAISFWQLKQYKDANVYYEKILELDAENIDAWLMQTVFLFSLIEQEDNEIIEKFTHNYNTTLKLFKKNGDKLKNSSIEGFVELSINIAVFLMLIGDTKQALSLLKGTFQYAKRINDLEKQGDVLMLLAELYEKQANYEDAWYSYLDAYRFFNKEGLKLKMAEASEALGTLEFYAQMFESSVINLRDSLELYEELGEQEKIKEVQNIILTVERNIKKFEIY